MTDDRLRERTLIQSSRLVHHMWIAEVYDERIGA